MNPFTQNAFFIITQSREGFDLDEVRCFMDYAVMLSELQDTAESSHRLAHVIHNDSGRALDITVEACKSWVDKNAADIFSDGLSVPAFIQEHCETYMEAVLEEYASEAMYERGHERSESMTSIFI